MPHGGGGHGGGGGHSGVGGRGGSTILGKGGLINIFTTGGGGGGTGGGVPPPVTARGSGGALIAAVFLLLRLFSMKFTVISNTYTSRDIRITRACMDSDEKTVHSSQCYGSYCSAIKFVTQSFCEFVTEACTWPSKHHAATCRYINDSCMFYYNISIFSLFSSIAICFLRKRI